MFCYYCFRNAIIRFATNWQTADQDLFTDNERVGVIMRWYDELPACASFLSIAVLQKEITTLWILDRSL